MAKILSMPSTALVALLIFILFPSAANAFFDSCMCNKIIPAANGSTGSANCQTGGTCDPSKLVEDACTVSCIQPFAQPVYKSGLSWLTADQINCTNGVFYANNKIINPTALNCKILPRCDKCTYTMSETCKAGYSCSSSPLLETNPYTNCTTLRCPNGYTGSVTRSDGSVVRLDSTLTCTSVNNQWKDYAGTYYANLQLTCAVFGTPPPTTSTSTTTTTTGTTTMTMTTTTEPQGCLIPPDTPCDMPPERCTSDIPIPDYSAGEMRCPSTSSLYVARTDTIGASEQYRWAGSVRCMVNGLWRTTADPTPREYKYDSFKMTCGVPPPETATYPGCDSPPSPPLLSPCPGASCSSIANATFVNYYGCKGLECPNDDQRIAVEGASVTGTHIRIETPTTFKLVDGNLADLGVFSWSTPAACVTYGAPPPTTSTSTTTTTSATTTMTMTTTTAPQGCPIPPNTPCDMPPERCSADIPIPDYATGEMRCPSTSSLYIARTDTIGAANLYSWAGSIRCMVNGLWRTTADIRPREYRYDSFKMICGVKPPESAPYEGCDMPPSPPLLSPCPGVSCSSIAYATFVTYLGCKGLECPNGDQRIAVEGAAGTGSHIEIYKDATFILFNGNQGELGVFPWNTPAACVTYDPNAPTTTTTPSTSTEKSQCASCSGSIASKSCRLYPCGVPIEEKTADGCRKFSCPEGFLAERYYLTTPTDRTYEAIALPATCEADGSTWTAADGKTYVTSLYLTCSTPGGSNTPVTTPAPPPTCSKCTFTQPRFCRREPCGELSTQTDSNGCLTLVCPSGFILESIPYSGTTYDEVPLPLTCYRDGEVWADASGSAWYTGNVLSCSTP